MGLIIITHKKQTTKVVLSVVSNFAGRFLRICFWGSLLCFLLKPSHAGRQRSHKDNMCQVRKLIWGGIARGQSSCPVTNLALLTERKKIIVLGFFFSPQNWLTHHALSFTCLHKGCLWPFVLLRVWRWDAAFCVFTSHLLSCLGIERATDSDGLILNIFSRQPSSLAYFLESSMRP